MINLIPPAAKKQVVREYWLRVFSVWLILWSFALFAAASMFFPVYILTKGQVDRNQSVAEEASQKVADYGNVTAALVQASTQAKTIVDEKNVEKLSSYLILLEELQGEGIQITTVSVNRTNKGVSPIVVEGVAADRQTLALFRDRLLADDTIAEVDLPISNLAQDKDISFTITITLANKNTV